MLWLAVLLGFLFGFAVGHFVAVPVGGLAWVAGCTTTTANIPSGRNWRRPRHVRRDRLRGHGYGSALVRRRLALGFALRNATSLGMKLSDQLQQPLRIRRRGRLLLVAQVDERRLVGRAQPVGPPSQFLVRVGRLAEADVPKRRVMFEIVDPDCARLREPGLDSIPGRMREVEGDEEAWVERAEDQLDHPLVPSADQLDAHRAEPVAEVADPRGEVRQQPRP